MTRLTKLFIFIVILILLTLFTLSCGYNRPEINTEGARNEETPSQAHLPVSGPKTSINLILTNQIVYAYTQRVDQTDSDPTTTAYRTKTRKGIIANNCFSFGSRVRVYGRSGGKSFSEWYIVEDRLNSRYGCNVWDIYFLTNKEAVKWGKRIMTVIVYDTSPNY